MRSSIHILMLCLLPVVASAQDDSAQKPTPQEEPAKKTSVPAVVHTKTGASFDINGQMTIRHIARHQHYNGHDTASYDVDIHSPKSVNLNPEGTRYYVNSLEGYKTIAYDARTHQKLAVIKHTFSHKDSALWAAPSGFYDFKHEYKTPDAFSGKPVESTFTHDGRYLWVPYYRRNYDINAQEPSAIAVIDTRSHKVVRLLETGALPKMVAASPDGHWVAVTHWGENTVGVIDVSSSNPSDWHYNNNYVIDYKLKLNLSTTVPVNRDVNSGYCLRGTVFTPDSRYLLVGCMGGNGGIAVIDMQSRSYLGRLLGMMSNVRHLLIHDGWLYLSINKSGAVQRIPLQNIISELPKMQDHKLRIEGWQTCKIPAGARTIEITADGRYIYAACNTGSCLAVVDVQRFTQIGQVPVDSYPVGLEVSADGRYVYVTSQGRSDRGGNAVNVFEVTYK